MSGIPRSTATLLARRTHQQQQQQHPRRSPEQSNRRPSHSSGGGSSDTQLPPATDTIGHGDQPKRNATPHVWMHTTPRRASMARMSLQLKTLPAYLIYVSENGAMQRFDLTKPEYTIGRKEDRDVVLQCPQISKHHASIERSEHGFVIRDHNSVNGTLVNGQAVDVCQHLCDKDRLQLGTVELTFHDEVEITPYNQRMLFQTHPAFAAHLGTRTSPLATVHDGHELEHDGGDADDDEDDEDDALPVGNNSGAARRASPVAPTAVPRRTYRSPLASKVSGPSAVAMTPEMERMRLSIASDLTDGSSGRSSSDRDSQHLGLVTILPSERKYEETLTVRAELNGEVSDDDFMPAKNINNMETLRDDYEKLRMAYELSKLGVTEINLLLEKTLELMFSVLPIDRGVVLLVDRKTGMLTTQMVKLRTEKTDALETKEILLSGTILKRVFATKSCFITSDAFEDPEIGMAKSIKGNSIRSVICVPLIAHNEVHGILHLDSQDRINAFAEKDLQLVKTISNQTAIAIENCKLINDIEKEITIRENLGRFLPPHVVDRVIEKGEEPIQKGGRHTRATILFADIRGFTQLSERSTPEEIVELLNDFFERLVQIVFKYDGVLDKYIGDCLMAGFGTLEGTEQGSELKAVRAAMEFKTAIRDMNHERVRHGKVPIEIGVGLNTGTLVAGYIGSSRRLEYTSIGDAVNTSSRICSMAQGDQVLISEDTFLAVRHNVEAAFVTTKQFKGKSTMVDVYEVKSIRPGRSI